MTFVGGDQRLYARHGWRDSPWTSLVVLALGFFLTMLDISIVNIAIPEITEDLGASISETLWAVNAYVLVVAVLLITTGRLGDLYGPHRLFSIGLMIFVVFSLLCGLARNPGELITARTLQGLGAALLLPQTMAMIVGIFPPARRGAALGIWGAIGGLAAITGPSLGGLLVTAWGWRWIFFVNVPVGLMTIVLARLAVPELRSGRRHRLDLGGVALISAGMFCLTFALMEGQRFDWVPWILALLGVAVVLIVGFIWYEGRRQGLEPLVPFTLFQNRDYTAMNVVTASISLGIIALMLLLTIFFQSALGFTALMAGLALAPPALVSTVLAPLSGRLSDRFDGKLILLTGLLLTALGMVWTLFVMRLGAAWLEFLPPLLVIGLGNGLIISPMATVAMRQIQPNMAGAASGIINTVRQLGSVVAVTLVGVLLQQQLPDRITGDVSWVYVDATRTGMALPIGAIMIGTVACVLARRKKPPRTKPQGLVPRVDGEAVQGDGST